MTKLVSIIAVGPHRVTLSAETDSAIVSPASASFVIHPVWHPETPSDLTLDERRQYYDACDAFVDKLGQSVGVELRNYNYRGVTETITAIGTRTSERQQLAPGRLA